MKLSEIDTLVQARSTYHTLTDLHNGCRTGIGDFCTAGARGLAQTRVLAHQYPDLFAELGQVAERYFAKKREEQGARLMMLGVTDFEGM